MRRREAAVACQAGGVFHFIVLVDQDADRLRELLLHAMRPGTIEHGHLPAALIREFVGQLPFGKPLVHGPRVAPHETQILVVVPHAAGHAIARAAASRGEYLLGADDGRSRR